MTNIELFPHNEEAYLAMIDSLEDSNFSFIERATGTGKSYILIKYIANVMAGKRVLFVTLHDSMFKQLTERDMPALGTSKDVCKKLDCILYSSIPKHTAKWYVDHYDCIIFDEAHHCGAPIWSQTIAEIRDLIAASEDKVMIGATATGTRYLDDYMDVAKEFFQGNVASKLYLSEAILREILPAPYYINFNNASIELLKNVEYKLGKLSKFKELDPLREQVQEYKKTIKEKTDISTLLKKYGVKKGEKYIVFCSNIADLKKKKEEAQEWFKDIGEIETYEAHSEQTGAVNQNQIDAFENSKNDKIKLMFAVDMFNEGLHIKDVDGILMTRKTSSPIVYLQQLGRVLSFSVRKKQVKVFDLAGNALDIDVIYNLYKELLSVAKDNIAAGIGNTKHYQEIIERFQIVDEGTILVDKLEDINKFLDDSYLKRAKISRYIAILKNYIDATKSDFMTLLRSGKVDREHLKIYKELQSLVDVFMIDDFLALNELGIVVSNIQLDDTILEKIRANGNYKNVKEKELQDFFSGYFMFYTKNKRRPSLNNPDEKPLAERYRELLTTLKSNKLKKYLKDSPYPLNVEELLILRDYPSSEELNAYMDMIEEKYEKGISLDILEQKAIAIINQIISLKDRPIIKNLTSNIVLKLDEHIKVIREYLVEHPNETFADIENFRTNEKIFKAIEFIHKNAKYITNHQFEILLSMQIKLPKIIDMSMEKRLDLLKGYDSFFDKEEAQNKANVKAITKFISENKRRPNIDNDDEKGLAILYKKLITEKGNRWSSVIVNSLLENEITLTIDEKIIYGYPLTKEDVNKLLERVVKQIETCDKTTFNPGIIRKQLRILKNHKKIDDKLFKIYYRTVALIEYVFGTNPNLYKGRLEAYLYNSQAIIPFNLLPYILKEFGISMIYVNKFLHYKDAYINVAEKNYQTEIKKKTAYIEYIKKHGKRPHVGSIEHNNLRDYLARASKYDIRLYVDELNQMGVPVALEELFLIGQTTKENEAVLYNKLCQRRKATKRADALDELLYKKLHLGILFSEDGYEKPITDTTIKTMNEEIKDDVVASIKTQIDENPSAPINYANNYIPENVKKELEEYRLIALSKMYIQNLINRMTTSNMPYTNLLDEEGIVLLNDIIRALKKYNTNLELVDKLMRLNRQIILDINNLDIETFMAQYISYIMKHNIEPTGDSEDPEGVVLASKYNLLKDILFAEEKAKLSYLINKTIEELNKKDFYSLFVEFIETHERFPSPLGETEAERSLAEQYKKLGSKLTGDKKKNISKLLKKYQANTIRYAKSRKG